MTTTKLCLGLALIMGVAFGIVGCNNPTRTGPPNDVVFFGRLADSYELCFYVREDFTALEPSTACDRDGESPYSFNIEVTGGDDGEGEPCTFDLRVTESIPIDEDGAFTFTETDAEDPSVIRMLSGQINVNSGFDAALGDAEEIRLVGEEIESICEVMWNASSGPVCREEAFARCQLLADCCASIYMVPSTMNECQEVVDACDPDECDALLTGFPGCTQPPICPLSVDPGRVCTELNDCCLDDAPLSKEGIEECQMTAFECNPSVCRAELDSIPECSGEGILAASAP